MTADLKAAVERLRNVVIGGLFIPYQDLHADLRAVLDALLAVGATEPEKMPHAHKCKWYDGNGEDDGCDSHPSGEKMHRCACGAIYTFDEAWLSESEAYCYVCGTVEHRTDVLCDKHKARQVEMIKEWAASRPSTEPAAPRSEEREPSFEELMDECELASGKATLAVIALFPPAKSMDDHLPQELVEIARNSLALRPASLLTARIALIAHVEKKDAEIARLERENGMMFGQIAEALAIINKGTKYEQMHVASILDSARNSGASHE